MFYETGKNDHGLPHDPFQGAIVAPRPIGWISSMSANGDANLAPYSFFNGICSRPPILMFSSEGSGTRSLSSARPGKFVCNLATWDLRDAMHLTSAPLARSVNEMEKAGLEAAPSRLIKPPRVAASPCALECVMLQIIQVEDLERRQLDCHVVFGQVVGVHIDDRYLRDGILDTVAMRPLARCGYPDYLVADTEFKMRHPAPG